MTGIQSFFTRLRKEGGAVWLEHNNIRLSTPAQLQNEDTVRFIQENKERIIAVLQENNITSKAVFRNIPALRESRHAQQPGKFQLIRPYHAKRNGRLPYLVFIHPGHGGWDVYQPLADMLKEGFNCIGIDNYNLHHTEKIIALPELAAYYLAALVEKKWLKEPVILLGWSLGGHIALETAAILEKHGYRHITVFLLDTFLPGPPVKYKRNAALELEELEIAEMAAAADNDKEKMAVTLEAEYLLASIPVSRYLKYTRVIFFRATRLHVSMEPVPGFAGKEAGQLPENYAEEAAATVHTIDLECDHYDILDTNGELIAEYLLSFL